MGVSYVKECSPDNDIIKDLRPENVSMQNDRISRSYAIPHGTAGIQPIVNVKRKELRFRRAIV